MSTQPADDAERCPMHTRAEKIAEALDGLLAQCADVDGAAVVSVDGFPIASAFGDEASDDEVAALGAALVSLSSRVADALGRGAVRHIVCEGDSGSIYAASAGAAVVCASARPSAPTGLVLVELRRAANAVATVLPATALPIGGTVSADASCGSAGPAPTGLRLVRPVPVSATAGESARIAQGNDGVVVAVHRTVDSIAESRTPGELEITS